MIRFLYYFRGYSVLSFSCEFIKDILNITSFNRIHVLNMAVKKDRFIIKIYTKDKDALILKLKEIPYELEYEKGFFKTLRKYKHRTGIFIGTAALLLAMFISPKFIWEIKISGNDALNYEYISDLLDAEGVHIGAFHPFIDRKKVYINIMKRTDKLSWIAVNFIGSSAYVEVVERDFYEETDNLALGANIIAGKDGQILEADIIKGRQVATAGSIVKKGELIVSGIYETQKMGTRMVYSDAKVLARVCDEFIIEIPLANTKKVYLEEKVLESTLKMFGKSINIFKNYSINNNNYDIIIRDNILTVSQNEFFPVWIESTVGVLYEEKEVLLTEEEALERAKHEFLNRLDSNSTYLDILGIEDSYKVEDNVLIYRCNVEAVENIAVVSEFEIQ